MFCPFKQQKLRTKPSILSTWGDTAGAGVMKQHPLIRLNCGKRQILSILLMAAN